MCVDGWFKGQSLRLGKSGVFPGNHVHQVDPGAKSVNFSLSLSLFTVSVYNLYKVHLSLSKMSKVHSPCLQSVSLSLALSRVILCLSNVQCSLYAHQDWLNPLSGKEDKGGEKEECSGGEDDGYLFSQSYLSAHFSDLLIKLFPWRWTWLTFPMRTVGGHCTPRRGSPRLTRSGLKSWKRSETPFGRWGCSLCRIRYQISDDNLCL